jgi:hypothetical protein
MANQTYKTLKNGTVLRKGDEWENKGEGDWTILPNSHFGDAIGWTNKFGFRRPIKAKAKRVKKPQDYYYLKEGDIIKDTDEWLVDEGGKWRVEKVWGDDKLWKDNVGKCRRKVEVSVQVEKPTRPTYYILTQEDKIEEGDEYFDKYAEKWVKSEYVGSKIPIPSPYRRLVK